MPGGNRKKAGARTGGVTMAIFDDPDGELELAPDWRTEGFTYQASSEEQAMKVRPLTQQLIDCCHLDVWPSNATVIDFGIDSDRHLGALQFAIRNELVTPEELDAAM